MGFTYAIQVPVGKEVRIKYMIEQKLLQSNPGIMAIHAFETFTQIFRGKDTAPKQLKSKVPGYIFVTVENTENYTSRTGGNKECGLGMNPFCWHFLKSIPGVFKILNRYIQHEEYAQFFELTDLEPTIQVREEKQKRSLKDMINKALDILKKQKEKKTQQIVHMLNKVQVKDRGKNNVYTIPFSLFQNTRDRIDPERQGEVRKLTNARFILPEIAKTVRNLCCG